MPPYCEEHERYFTRNSQGGLTCLECEVEAEHIAIGLLLRRDIRNISRVQDRIPQSKNHRKEISHEERRE